MIYIYYGSKVSESINDDLIKYNIRERVITPGLCKDIFILTSNGRIYFSII